MTILVRYFRSLTVAQLLAAAAVMVLVLAAVLIRLPWPLSCRTFAVPGTAVGVHWDGRVLVAQDHAVAIVDPRDGTVGATVSLENATPIGGFASRQGSPLALTLARAGDVLAEVSIAVDRAVVTATAAHPTSSRTTDTSVARTVGISREGALISAVGDVSIGKMPLAVDDGGMVWTADEAGVGGVPGSGPVGYNYLSVSPDGSLLYALGRERALVIDTATKSIRTDIARTEVTTGVGLNSRVTMTLLLAADGQHILTTGNESRQVVVRSLSGSAVAVVDAGGPVHGIALSPDGATLYAILSDRLLAIDVSRYT